MRLMKIKYGKVNIFTKINSIKWLSSIVSKIKKKLNFFTKKFNKIKNKVCVVSMSLIKKSDL